jgi:hypothetical protein
MAETSRLIVHSVGDMLMVDRPSLARHEAERAKRRNRHCPGLCWRIRSALFELAIACFAVLAVVFALDVFSPAVGSPMASLITGLALGLILPVMTMWEAWNDLRGSEGRQREKAKAIIAGHIRTSSRGSLPDSPLVF